MSIIFEQFNTHLTINYSVSGLELCPKCKKGHLYPAVTAYASASAEPKGQFKETGALETTNAIFVVISKKQ